MLDTLPITLNDRVLFDGTGDGFSYAGRHYRLSCGAYLVQLPSGELLTYWLTGSRTEPAPDNCLALSRSNDGGKTWSAPEMLVPPGDENGAGMLYVCDEKLVLLSARWPAESCYTVWHYARRESADGGRTWSKEEPIALPTVPNASASLGGLLKTKDGTCLLCTTVYQKRTRPLRVGAARLALAKSEAEAAALPPRKPGEDDPTKFGTHLHGCGVFETDAECRTFRFRGWVHNRPMGLLEPTMVELTDGTLVMLMRAELGGFLWRSESRDGGFTWSDAVQTEIPNPSTQVNVTRLPDGRIVLLHNPTGGKIGEPLKMANRDPLSVYISSDELKSFSVCTPSLTGGALSYPFGAVLQDGRFVFVYDRNRNQVRFVETDL